MNMWHTPCSRGRHLCDDTGAWEIIDYISISNCWRVQPCGNKSSRFSNCFIANGWRSGELCIEQLKTRSWHSRIKSHIFQKGGPATAPLDSGQHVLAAIVLSMELQSAPGDLHPILPPGQPPPDNAKNPFSRQTGAVLLRNSALSESWPVAPTLRFTSLPVVVGTNGSSSEESTLANAAAELERMS